jgi:hypothetical protein
MERQSVDKDKSTSSKATDAVEQRVMAFAEQLGRAIGSVQAKADGLVDLDAVQEQMTRIRDGAAGLLDQLGGGQRARSRKPKAKAATRGKTVKTAGPAKRGKAAGTKRKRTGGTTSGKPTGRQGRKTKRG